MFSIIIPLHNGEKTIARALASLISSKEYIDEVIIVNDRSTDKYLDEIKPFTRFLNIVHVDSEFDKGPGGARRTGLLKATGTFVGFLDADDCYTASCLYYVNKQILENPDAVVIRAKTIYYESGDFNSEDITYSVGSCGGNFYNRFYLIRNQLLPHESLYMAEDEYFNAIIDRHMEYVGEEEKTLYFDYPVYEVHHDSDIYTSFAHGNWVDYACKYHLLMAEYMVDHCIAVDEMDDNVEDNFISSLVFCFLMCNAMMYDDFMLIDSVPHFNRAIKYYEKTFGKNVDNIVRWFEDDADRVYDLKIAAEGSTGIEFDEVVSFRKFMRACKGGIG